MPNKGGFRNKRIVFYGRRNTGLVALIYLANKKKKSLKIISDDPNILWYAQINKLEVVNFENMGEYDLFICVHGNKILEPKYLKSGIAVNIHPCLGLYPGANPIKKYIKNKNTQGSVDSHYMTEIVDGGDIIHSEFFETGVVDDYADFYNIALPYYIKCLELTLKKVSDCMRIEPKWVTEMVGKKFGMLTVVSLSKWVNGVPYMNVLCECGKSKDVLVQSIKRGATLSCGCFNRERLKESILKHGHGRKGNQTKVFRVWCAMKERCYNKKNEAYKNYGGRGIKICDRWLGDNGFFNFLTDMGERPTPYHSIDRINNDGDYEPKNCRWATKQEQLNNKRNNVYVLYNGLRITATEFANKIGANPKTILNKLKKGLSVEEIINNTKK